MNEDPREQKLDAAYRRASAEDADRPAASTRKAIMAEAAAAARRRAPASNDSRYVMRAVAAVAVIGVGVLIWRQTDWRMPGETPVYAEQAAAVPAASAEEQYVADAPDVAMTTDLSATRTAPESLQQAQAPAEDSLVAQSGNTFAREARSAAATAPATAPAPSPAPPPAASSPGVAQRARTNGVAASGDASERELAESAAAASAAKASPGLSEARAAALLAANFPEQHRSEQFHRVWLVLAEDGDVLLSGELQSGQALRDLDEQLERGLAGRTPQPWEVRQLHNTRGQLIELSVARVVVGTSDE